MSDEKVRENRLRRVAVRRGLRLVKSRRRDPQALDFGCYALVDASANVIVFGTWATGRLEATLDEIEGFLFPPKKRAKGRRSKDGR